MSSLVFNMIASGGGGISLEPFGCTKCTVDEFVFATDTYNTNLTCSMVERPKYAWLVREYIDIETNPVEGLLMVGGRVLNNTTSSGTYPPHSLGSSVSGGKTYVYDVSSCYLDFLNYTGTVSYRYGSTRCTLKAGIKYYLIAIA